MVPSVYDLVEAYRKMGRINSKAAYSTLETTEADARKTPMDVDKDVLIDAMMYVDGWLPRFIKKGCSNMEVNVAAEEALEASRQWHKVENADDELTKATLVHIKEYLTYSAVDNYNSQKRGLQTFNERVRAITQMLELPNQIAEEILICMPQRYPAEVISGTKGSLLYELILRYCKRVGIPVTISHKNGSLIEDLTKCGL